MNKREEALREFATRPDVIKEAQEVAERSRNDLRRRISVNLTEEEFEFLNWALQDKMYGECANINELMARMFYLQLREDMETSEEEAN